MANTEENNEQTTGKVPFGGKMDPTLYAVIEQLRTQEYRNFTNMVEVLLMSHPRIQPMLEAETAGAGA